MKKGLLPYLLAFTISGCSTLGILQKKGIPDPKPRIDTLYVPVFIQNKVDFLDTLKGDEAYAKAKEFYEKAENEYNNGNEDSSKYYFNLGTRMISQSDLSTEDWNFLDPLGSLNNLEHYLSEKSSDTNDIEITKSDISSAEKKFPFGERFAERVAYYEKLFETKQNKWFRKTLERLTWYSPYIDSLLRAKKLPEIVKYMYPIESGMENNATSDVGAKGIGQFMQQTARLRGLKVNSPWYDERLDPLKSLPASMDYINYLYSTLNRINLAMGAYNTGEIRVVRRLKNFNSDNFEELLKDKVLPQETLDYIPKIYAFWDLAKRTDPKDMKENKVLENLLSGNFDTLTVHRQTGFRAIANILGVPEKTIKEYNPAYPMGATPPMRREEKDYSYVIRIPKGENKEELLSRLSKMKNRVEIAGGYYRIKRGDSLWKIARRFHVPLYELKKLNNFPSPRRLRPGKRILVPGN